jgi:hypothetical protein
MTAWCEPNSLEFRFHLRQVDVFGQHRDRAVVLEPRTSGWKWPLQPDLRIAAYEWCVDMIVRENIRLNRTSLPEVALVVADPLIISGTWFVFYIAMSFLARSGVTVMRNDSRQPILYLRSFRADASFWASADSAEHELIRAVSLLGPVVAIGAPGRTVPPLGAARLKVDDDHWQDVVKALIESAQLIFLRIGSSEGFWWELEYLVEAAEPLKVKIFLPHEDRGAIYTEFRARASKVLPFTLPEDPKAARLLAFSSDWTPRLLAEAPSRHLRLREWLGSGAAPAIRAALFEGSTVASMGFGFKEWGTIVFVFLLLLSLLTGAGR